MHYLTIFQRYEQIVLKEVQNEKNVFCMFIFAWGIHATHGLYSAFEAKYKESIE